MKYDFKTKELIWTKSINDCAKEYCQFMKTDRLPRFKIKYVYDLNEIRYSMQTLTYYRPVILNINVGFMLRKDFDYKTILFHEFTHMLDSEIYLQNTPLNSKSKSLSLFTEFHATYIEGAYTISKNQDSDGLEYLINEKIHLIDEAINKLKSENNPVNYDVLIKSYMYYYGIIVAHNQFFENIIKPQVFDTIYDKNLQLYYNALKFLEIDQRIFVLSSKVQEIIDQQFIQSTKIIKM